MAEGRDIRFTEKKVDESWKERASRDKDVVSPKQGVSPKSSAPQPKASKPFMNLITSLGYQAMVLLGEVAHPETQQKEVHIEAAKEVIDLLSSLKDKTQGNLSPEENELIETLVPDLQMKFAQKV